MNIESLDCVGQKNRWLNLWRLRYDHNGHKGTWLFASRQDEPSLVKGGDIKADAVVIIPVAVDPHGGDRCGLVCVKEFRYPIGRYEYGFPAGLIEGKTLKETVNNEIREETGLIVKDILAVSPALVSSAGMSDETGCYALALVEPETDYESMSSANQEKSEDIHPFICTPSMALDICRQEGEYKGGAVSARAWPILMFYALNGLSGVCKFFMDGLYFKKNSNELDN